jgi:transcriptional regulator of acetoin/glycerol metabolism
MLPHAASRHAARVLSVLDGPAAGSSVEVSWQRCLLRYHLDPEKPEPPTVLSGLELRHARGQAGRLMRVADPELDQLHAIVSGVGYSVLMTDLSGAIIARRVRDADDGGCREWRLCTGALWSEEIEGTNGVGTCLAEQRPITIHRGQHFRRRHTRLTCTVAPLFNAGGELAGALDISSFRPDPEGGILPLAMAAVQSAARRIEAAHFQDIFSRCLILALPEREPGCSVPLLALDAERRLVGATRAARDMLRLDEAMLRRSAGLDDILDGSHAAPSSFCEAERMVLAGALAQSQGNVTAAAALLGISRATLHRKLRRVRLST